MIYVHWDLIIMAWHLQPPRSLMHMASLPHSLFGKFLSFKELCYHTVLLSCSTTLMIKPSKSYFSFLTDIKVNQDFFQKLPDLLSSCMAFLMKCFYMF